jgi:predicted nucleic acid-binding protein
MALTARFFVDTSAAARMSNHLVAEKVSPLIEAGLVATCGVLDAEALYSARSADEYETLRADRIAAYEYVPTNDEHWQAALNAQRLLARTGRHRSVGIADLLTSVLAGVNQLTVLHYDADFEVAATVLEFEQRWVATRGTL